MKQKRIDREQPGRPRLLSHVLGFALTLLALASMGGCPEKTGAQTSGDAARDVRNGQPPPQSQTQPEWSTALQTGAPPQGHGELCAINEYLPQYATGSLGRTVDVLQQIYDQQLCVNDAQYGRREATPTGTDTIYIPCQNWNDCYDKSGNKTGGKCNYETADLLFQLTPQVPACVRSKALVRAYQRSAELPDKARVDDKINGLVYRTDGHILFSSEFFAWDSRMPGRYDLHNPQDQKRFAEVSERNFVGTKALRHCMLQIDFNDPASATKQPEIDPTFKSQVSRGRALFHEYLHGVTQQQRTTGKTDPVPSFARITPAWGYMNMSLPELVQKGVLTEQQARTLTGEFGSNVQTVSQMLQSSRSSYRTEDGRFYESVRVQLSQVNESKVTTPQLIADMLGSKIGLLHNQMKEAVRNGQQQRWLDLLQEYCAAVHKRAELLGSLGFAARHENDVHSQEDTEEAFVIAVEMAVYDKAGFERQYTKEQQRFVTDWWKRSFDCDLADVRRWVREVG